jgi:hypothetical protein
MFGVQVLKLLKLTVGGVDFSAIPTRPNGLALRNPARPGQVEGMQ